MSSSLKTVFESLAPGNLYRVGLYCAPTRQPAISDIDGGEERKPERLMPMSFIAAHK
jgi:hypothetical protein